MKDLTCSFITCTNARCIRRGSCADAKGLSKANDKKIAKKVKKKQYRLDIFKRDGNKCLHCGSTENLSIDHIIPISKGGKDQAKNYQTLCKTCNVKKGNKITN